MTADRGEGAVGPSAPFLDAAAIRAALPPEAAVDAVTTALRRGLDPRHGVPRSIVPVHAGELLLMPAQSERFVGVKLATIAPGNPDHDLPRISAVYVLFDAATLRPAATLDGVALTTLRTPAVSVAAVRPWLDRRRDPLRIVCFGAGPQGLAHVETVAAVHSVAAVLVVVRNPGRVPVPDFPGDVRVVAADDARVTPALAAANVVVCATTARTPLFDSGLLRDDVIVVAVGSHEPTSREVDTGLVGRSTVVVEDIDTARRECGDIVLAEREGELDPGQLVPLFAVARGDHAPGPGPVLFTGSGMSWEDLVVAEAVLAARSSPPG